MMLLSILAASSVLGVVSSHGFSSSPMARQVICKEDGGYWWPQDGSLVPNAACKNIVVQNGTSMFSNAHEFSKNVLQYNNIEQVQKAIPNGRLCSAGNVDRTSIDTPSHTWQKNSVILDADNKFSMDIEFCAHAPHNPSFWDVYISKPNYSAAKTKLKWTDLQKIAHFDNLTPIEGQVKNCDTNKYYKLEDVEFTVPRGQADAVMYIRWQRDDAAGEGFYNCVDLNFDHAKFQNSHPMSREQEVCGDHLNHEL